MFNDKRNRSSGPIDCQFDRLEIRRESLLQKLCNTYGSYFKVSGGQYPYSSACNLFIMSPFT